jgi:hypothetical protein
MSRPPGQRLVLRSPGRERVARLAAAGEWLLLPPSLFWVAFALAVFGVWQGPLDAYKWLPSVVQVIALIVCPALAIVAAVIRLRWDRSHAPRVRRSWRLLAFGILFLILTGVATFRAVSI